MSTQMIKAKLNGEYEIVLPKHRADREEWYTPYGWEKKRLASMHANLGKGDVIYYVGAEEGEMTALCQIWGAEVVMFEPNPKAWAHIKAIWEANNLERPLGIVPGFASDITVRAKNPQADMEIEEPNGWPKCANEEMIAAHGFKELDKEAESYDQARIDDVVAKSGFIPTAISLDVEGAEGIVLRGAENTLTSHHPKIWLSGHPEFLHENFKGRAGFEYLRELRDWLKKDLGYKEDILDYDHEVHLYYHL